CMTQGNVVQCEDCSRADVENARAVVTTDFNGAAAVDGDVGGDIGEGPFSRIKRDGAGYAESDGSARAGAALASSELLTHLRSQAVVAQITYGLICGLDANCRRQQN